MFKKAAFLSLALLASTTYTMETPTEPATQPQEVGSIECQIYYVRSETIPSMDRAYSFGAWANAGHVDYSHSYGIRFPIKHDGETVGCLRQRLIREEYVSDDKQDMYKKGTVTFQKTDFYIKEMGTAWVKTEDTENLLNLSSKNFKLNILSKPIEKSYL